jgi:plastocyanin
MTRTRRRTRHLAQTVAALFFAGAPAATLAEAALSASFSNPPYAFTASCDLSQPLAFVNLIVVNRGDAITVSLGPRRLGPLAVSVPATFCATAAPGAAKLTVPASSTQSAIQRRQPHPQPAVPRNVQVARGTKECAAHVGLFGALACPAMIKSGDVLLVWDWQAGAGPDAIDGFRLYRVAGGTKQLVYTRADKNSLTLVDLPGSAAGYIGTCFAVTAYAGANESALSNALCVTRQQIVVLASPTVNSTTQPAAPAPKHVVIHVTGDSFPANTIVAAGGDVTWINDDTDEHSVYGPAGSFVGDLYANGGRFTYTFRDIGTKYTVPYLCQYHAGMHGTITVVTNH